LGRGIAAYLLTRRRLTFFSVYHPLPIVRILVTIMAYGRLGVQVDLTLSKQHGFQTGFRAHLSVARP
jgi:hypothetical protein